MSAEDGSDKPAGAYHAPAGVEKECVSFVSTEPQVFGDSDLMITPTEPCTSPGFRDEDAVLLSEGSFGPPQTSDQKFRGLRHIDSDHLERLKDIVLTGDDITTLSLHRCAIPDMFALADCVSSAGVKYLDLSFCRLGEDILVQFFHHITQTFTNTALRKLDVSYNLMGLKSVRLFTALGLHQSVIGTSLRSLTVAFNPITAIGMGELLHMFPFLRKLDASYCGILHNQAVDVDRYSPIQNAMSPQSWLACAPGSPVFPHTDKPSRRTYYTTANRDALVALITDNVARHLYLTNVYLEGNGFTPSEVSRIDDIVAGKAPDASPSKGTPEGGKRAGAVEEAAPPGSSGESVAPELKPDEAQEDVAPLAHVEISGDPAANKLLTDIRGDMGVWDLLQVLRIEERVVFPVAVYEAHYAAVRKCLSHFLTSNPPSLGSIDLTSIPPPNTSIPPTLPWKFGHTRYFSHLHRSGSGGGGSSNMKLDAPKYGDRLGVRSPSASSEGMRRMRSANGMRAALRRMASEADLSRGINRFSSFRSMVSSEGGCALERQGTVPMGWLRGGDSDDESAMSCSLPSSFNSDDDSEFESTATEFRISAAQLQRLAGGPSQRPPSPRSPRGERPPSPRGGPNGLPPLPTSPTLSEGLRSGSAGTNSWRLGNFSRHGTVPQFVDRIAEFDTSTGTLGSPDGVAESIVVEGPLDLGFRESTGSLMTVGTVCQTPPVQATPLHGEAPEGMLLPGTGLIRRRSSARLSLKKKRGSVDFTAVLGKNSNDAEAQAYKLFKQKMDAQRGVVREASTHSNRSDGAVSSKSPPPPSAQNEDVPLLNFYRKQSSFEGIASLNDTIKSITSNASRDSLDAAEHGTRKKLPSKSAPLLPYDESSSDEEMLKTGEGPPVPPAAKKKPPAPTPTPAPDLGRRISGFGAFVDGDDDDDSTAGSPDLTPARGAAANRRSMASRPSQESILNTTTRSIGSTEDFLDSTYPQIMFSLHGRTTSATSSSHSSIIRVTSPEDVMLTPPLLPASDPLASAGRDGIRPLQVFAPTKKSSFGLPPRSPPKGDGSGEAAAGLPKGEAASTGGDGGGLVSGPPTPTIVGVGGGGGGAPSPRPAAKRPSAFDKAEPSDKRDEQGGKGAAPSPPPATASTTTTSSSSSAAASSASPSPPGGASQTDAAKEGRGGATGRARGGVGGGGTAAAAAGGKQQPGSADAAKGRGGAGREGEKQDSGAAKAGGGSESSASGPILRWSFSYRGKDAKDAKDGKDAKEGKEGKDASASDRKSSPERKRAAPAGGKPSGEPAADTAKDGEGAKEGAKPSAGSSSARAPTGRKEKTDAAAERSPSATRGKDVRRGGAGAQGGGGGGGGGGVGSPQSPGSGTMKKPMRPPSKNPGKPLPPPMGRVKSFTRSNTANAALGSSANASQHQSSRVRAKSSANGVSSTGKGAPQSPVLGPKKLNTLMVRTFSLDTDESQEDRQRGGQQQPFRSGAVQPKVVSSNNGSFPSPRGRSSTDSNLSGQLKKRSGSTPASRSRSFARLHVDTSRRDSSPEKNANGLPVPKEMWNHSPSLWPARSPTGGEWAETPPESSGGSPDAAAAASAAVAAKERRMRRSHSAGGSFPAAKEKKDGQQGDPGNGSYQKYTEASLQRLPRDLRRKAVKEMKKSKAKSTARSASESTAAVSLAASELLNATISSIITTSNQSSTPSGSAYGSYGSVLEHIGAGGSNVNGTFKLLETAIEGDFACLAFLGNDAYAALPSGAGKAQGVPEALRHLDARPSAVLSFPPDSPIFSSSLSKLLFVLTDPGVGAKTSPELAEHAIKRAADRRLSATLPRLLTKLDYAVATTVLKEVHRAATLAIGLPRPSPTHPRGGISPIHPRAGLSPVHPRQGVSPTHQRLPVRSGTGGGGGGGGGVGGGGGGGSSGPQKAPLTARKQMSA